MKRLSLLLCCILSLHTFAADSGNPIAILHTNAGDITIELYPDKAPVSVANFLAYASEGFYDGTIFHRVEKRFVIQGGGFSSEFQKKPTRDPIVNESTNGLHNDRWTVAMARTDDPDSATSQFYINLRMNSSLDRGRGKVGYAVFGKVIDGQYVVSDISKRETGSVGNMSSVPLETVLINSVEIKQ